VRKNRFSQLFFRDNPKKKQYNDSASKILCECLKYVFFTAVREDVPERMSELDLTKVVNHCCFIVGSSPTFPKGC
jgi:hypothetical protein